jgi:hypothetical protein
MPSRVASRHERSSKRTVDAISSAADESSAMVATRRSVSTASE